MAAFAGFAPYLGLETATVPVGRVVSTSKNWETLNGNRAER